MLNSKFNRLIGILISLFLFVGNLNSQPAFRAKERIAEFKKMKLLEVLELDEKTSEKFLAKYTSNEKILREKQEKLDEAILDLEYLIRKKASKDEISKQTQKVQDLQRDLLNTMLEQQKDLKSILTEEQFARYIVFETRFRERLQQAIIERAKGRGWQDEQGPPKKRKGVPPGDNDVPDFLR